MSTFDDVITVPRRTMVLFFIIDTSGSMEGTKIASVNVALQEVMPYIDDISANNADAEIKVAAMEFSSGCEWMYPQPMDAGSFQWRNLEAGGLTQLGEACQELEKKLHQEAFMKAATGSFAPAFILMSDGDPTDDYKRGLDKLKGNKWFNAGIKVAIAIGDEGIDDKEVLAQFTGNKEAVLTVHNKEQLKKIIHFVSVTASQVASRSASVGTGAPESKNDEVAKKVSEAVNNDPSLGDVDTGTGKSGAVDDWGEDAAGW